MDAFRLAVAEIGDAPPEQLTQFIEEKYGVQIEARFLPFFRASLHDLEHLTRRRREAAKAAEPSPNVPNREK
jgi:hypothetical protein